MTRHEAIFRDVPRLQAERLKLLEAIELTTDPAAIAIMLRRVDRIEERFDEVHLDEGGEENYG